MLTEPNGGSRFDPIYTQTSRAQLSGLTSKPASVEFSRDNKILSQTQTDSAGRFDVEDLPLTPGLNIIECNATSLDSSREEAVVFAAIVWEPLKPEAPTLDQLPSTVNAADIVIKGASFARSSVKIDVQPVKGKRSTQASAPVAIQKDVKAGDDGRFEVVVRLMDPAKYEITAISRNSKGTQSKPSQKIETTYDPYWYPNLPPAVAEPSKFPRRKATIMISHKTLSINVEVAMARDDPLVPGLVANQANLQKFLNDTFRLRLNGSWSSSEFRGVEPRISLSDKLLIISASATPYLRDRMPILSGNVKVSIFPLASSRDSLTIVTSDYLVQSFSPAPSTVENNVATWLGPDDQQLPTKDTAVDGEIDIQLEYSPLSSPGKLIRFLQMSPYSLWTYPANILPTLLYGILNAIPILWILLFLKPISQQTSANQATFEDLMQKSHELAVLSLVAPVWNVAYGLGYLLFRTIIHDFNRSDAPDLLITASMLIVIVSSAAQLLVVRSKATWAEWLREICRATRSAALINVGLIAVFKFEAGRPRLILATQILIGFAVLLVILIYVRALVRGLGITFKHPRWWGGLALLLLVALSVPFGRMPSSNFPSIDVLFHMIRELAPAIAAIVLVVLLKKLSDSGQDVSGWMAQAALIIFCGYLVGATTAFFMVPIPFILSFLAFRKFVITSADTSNRLAAVEASVFQSRRDLIDKVIANDAAQAMKNNVDKLGDKVVSGDLDIAEFKKRAKEIEDYAAESEGAATLAGDLPAESAVLSVGILPERWHNAMWAVKFGALLSLPFLVVYLAELLIRGGLLFGEYYRLLISLTRIATFLAEWLIGAFFFGYFFKNIQGNSGLKKGLRVGCAVIVCFLPVWFISTTSRIELLAIFLRAGQTFLFFTFLGLASDYKVFKDTMSHGFRWRLFTRFGDMPSFTAVASVVITTIGVTLTTVLTGQFKELVAQLVGTALNQPAPHP